MTFIQFLEVYYERPNPLCNVVGDPCLPLGKGVDIDDLIEHFTNNHGFGTGFRDAIEDAWENWHRQRYYERI